MTKLLLRKKPRGRLRFFSTWKMVTLTQRWKKKVLEHQTSPLLEVSCKTCPSDYGWTSPLLVCVIYKKIAPLVSTMRSTNKSIDQIKKGVSDYESLNLEILIEYRLEQLKKAAHR